MSAYPGTFSTFLTHTNIADIIDAGHVNLLQVEVLGIEGALGTNPQQSTAPVSTGTYNFSATSYTNLNARLANIEQGIVADTHNQYMKLLGGSVIANSVASQIPLVLKAAASQSVDVFELQDSTGTKQFWVDKLWTINGTNGLSVSAGGASIVGNVTVGGALAAQTQFLTGVSAGAVGSVIRLAPSATADALQVQNNTGTTLARFDASGNLFVPNLTVTGSSTIAGSTIYASQADLSPVAGTSTATGTGTGDKISMYRSGINGSGFGIGSGTGFPLVAYIAARFSIRLASGSGAASSGAELFAVDSSGNATVTGTLAVAGTGTFSGSLSSNALGAVTLTVGGTTTLGGALSVSGNATFSGTLNGLQLGGGASKGLYTGANANDLAVRSQTSSGNVSLQTNNGATTMFTASTSGISIGTGPTLGAYGGQMHMTQTWALSQSTWQNAVYDTMDFNAGGALTIVGAQAHLVSTHTGGNMMYTGQATWYTPLTSGGNASATRVVTQGGSIIAYVSVANSVGPLTCPFTTVMPGGGVYLVVQQYQNSGGNYFIPIDSPSQPNNASIGALR